MSKQEKHPAVVAWERWITSEVGVNASSGSPSGEYLENRLWRAFFAGVEYAEAQARAAAHEQKIIENFKKK